MTGWPSALVAMLLGGTVAGTPLFAFQDPAITESSGLVDAGRTVYTVNDSGSQPVLYAVDAGNGRTRATTTYTSADVTDVEALAPAPGGDVWVGDIGDNLRSRDAIAVYRVTPGQPDATRIELTYPDGPRDAETLLAHPRTGRLFVVSKTVFGGTVYAAPRRLEPVVPNPMRAVAVVPGLLTDGTFLPDGRHVLLRGYGAATLLSFPDFAVLGSFDLPEQEQGEGLSVGDDGRILLSSEGRGAEVLLLELPDRLAKAFERPEPRPAAPSPTSGDSPTPTSKPSKRADEPTRQASDVQTRRVGGWVLLGTIGALVVTGVVSAVRSRRRPGE